MLKKHVTISIMQEYKVRVKDHTQNTTHELTEHATSPNEANQQALKYLRKHIGNNEYTITSTKTPPKYTYYS